MSVLLHCRAMLSFRSSRCSDIRSNHTAQSKAWQLTGSFALCAGIRYIQENDYPVRGTYGLA